MTNLGNLMNAPIGLVTDVLPCAQDIQNALAWELSKSVARADAHTVALAPDFQGRWGKEEWEGTGLTAQAAMGLTFAAQHTYHVRAAIRYTGHHTGRPTRIVDATVDATSDDVAERHIDAVWSALFPANFTLKSDGEPRGQHTAPADATWRASDDGATAGDLDARSTVQMWLKGQHIVATVQRV